MSREKEICCGEPTRPAPKFRLSNSGNRVRVNPVLVGAHECVTCGMVYPPGTGQAEWQEAMSKYVAVMRPPMHVSIVDEEEEQS